MSGKKADAIYLSRDFEFNDSKTMIVFLWLLFNANEKRDTYGNDVIERGMVAVKNSTIAAECNLTIDNVRKALSKLDKSGNIKRQRRSFYQLIQIPDYDHYVKPF